MASYDPSRKNKAQTVPEIAPEDKIGVTDREKAWVARRPPRQHVPGYVFICIVVFLLLAFAGGGFWYYRKNILPEKYYLQAEAQFNSGNYRKAFTLYKKAAKIQPARRDIYNNMARTQAKLGDSNNAATYYEIHLKQQPDDVKALWEAADLYVELKNYDRAMELLDKATDKRGDDGSLTEKLAEVALRAGYKEKAAAALAKSAMSYNDQAKVLKLAKKLMILKDYCGALNAYKRATALAPDDPRGLHGTNAAKAMLDIPSDPAMIIVPGVSLGKVKLGDSRDEVKSAMGSPERKLFTKMNGTSVEIWRYGINDKNRSMTVFFTGGKTREIETRYKNFKTEDSLGAGNFLLDKHRDKIGERVELSDGRTRFSVKGGGLSFYAAGINEAGNGAKYAKLIVHKKREKPLDENKPSWLENLMTGEW